MRYIELNPVLAVVVNDPADYSWLSYPCTALSQANELISHHDEYRRLGRDGEGRQANYRTDDQG